MNYFFSSDYHLGHYNIIKYCNRPFKSLHHMNEIIIHNHNERVKEDDILFHIGDFSFRNSLGGKLGEGIPITSKYWESCLNGKIYHICGNHDRNNSTKTIIQGILIKYCKVKAWLVHNPIHYNPNYELNLTAHVHEKWLIKRPGDIIYDHNKKPIVLKSTLFNVGVDVNQFRPIKFTEILHKLKKHS